MNARKKRRKTVREQKNRDEPQAHRATAFHFFTSNRFVGITGAPAAAMLLDWLLGDADEDDEGEASAFFSSVSISISCLRVSATTIETIRLGSLKAAFSLLSSSQSRRRLHLLMSLASSSSSLADFDLTSSLAPFLDKHMFFQLLEFLQKCHVCPLAPFFLGFWFDRLLLSFSFLHSSLLDLSSGRNSKSQIGCSFKNFHGRLAEITVWRDSCEWTKHTWISSSDARSLSFLFAHCKLNKRLISCLLLACLHFFSIFGSSWQSCCTAKRNLWSSQTVDWYSQ